MKHLIETADLSSLGIAEYDRLILDSSKNEIVYRGGVTYEYVDLGLSVKWAKCNVGAEKETDAGLYFAWGETTGYTASQVGTDKQFSWSDYKYGNSSSNLTKYNQSDGKTVLESADDAPSQIMGSDWRMPTNAEIQELLDNTDYEWFTNYNGSGVNGTKFTSKTNGNSIFIPAAGGCSDGSVFVVGNGGYRCGGRSVRGVRK